MKKALPGTLSQDEVREQLHDLPRGVQLLATVLISQCGLDFYNAFVVGPGVAVSSLGRKASVVIPPVGHIPLNFSCVACQETPFRTLRSAGNVITEPFRALSRDMTQKANRLSPLQKQILLEQEETQLEVDLNNHDVLRRASLANEDSTRMIVEDEAKRAQAEMGSRLSELDVEKQEQKASLSQIHEELASQLLSHTGQRFSMLQLLARPLLSGTVYDDALVSIWNTRSYDSHVLLNLEGLDSLKDLLSSNHKGRLTTFMREALAGCMDTLVYAENLIPKPALSLLLSLLPSEFHRLVKQEDAFRSGILSNSILLPGGVPSALIELPEDVQSSWKALQGDLLAARIKPHVRAVRCTPGAVERFTELQRLCEGQSEAFVLPGYARLYSCRALHAVKLAAAWAQFKEELVVTRGLLDLAFAVLEHLRLANLPFLEEVLCSPVQRSDGDEALFRMIQKVEEKPGGISRRDLYRRYNTQRKKDHEPTLEKGLRLGLLEEKNGLLFAASYSSCQCSSGGSAVSSQASAESERVEKA